MKRKIVAQKFWGRDSVKVAQDLLGKYLVRKVGQKEVAGMICEVEVYDGFHDRASHAWKGETKRTAVMFGRPGHIYAYLCYGIHTLLNIVTREHGYPAAILIRSVEGISGPGRVGKHFNIRTSLTGQPLGFASGLWVEDRGVSILPSQILRTPRIGVSYAGPIWIRKKLRFLIQK
jgi:DNA-3-methyladenine glycosylase